MQDYGWVGVALLVSALILGITNALLCNAKAWKVTHAAIVGTVMICLAAAGGPLFGSALGFWLATR